MSPKKDLSLDSYSKLFPYTHMRSDSRNMHIQKKEKDIVRSLSQAASCLLVISPRVRPHDHHPGTLLM